MSIRPDEITMTPGEVKEILRSYSGASNKTIEACHRACILIENLQQQVQHLTQVCEGQYTIGNEWYISGCMQTARQCYDIINGIRQRKSY